MLCMIYKYGFSRIYGSMIFSNSHVRTQAELFISTALSAGKPGSRPFSKVASSCSVTEPSVDPAATMDRHPEMDVGETRTFSPGCEVRSRNRAKPSGFRKASVITC